jgi:hypothetical protein
MLSISYNKIEKEGSMHVKRFLLSHHKATQHADYNLERINVCRSTCLAYSYCLCSTRQRTKS